MIRFAAPIQWRPLSSNVGRLHCKDRCATALHVAPSEQFPNFSPLQWQARERLVLATVARVGLRVPRLGLPARTNTCGGRLRSLASRPDTRSRQSCAVLWRSCKLVAMSAPATGHPRFIGSPRTVAPKAAAAASCCAPSQQPPNPSLERTSTGLSPRSSLVHDPLRGANPAAAAQLKR